jgi:SAM-dependent methyltransferase
MSTLATLPAPAAKSAEEFITDLIGGFWLSRSVSVAAQLGLADLVHDVPRSIFELARETGTDADALYRLMRALASAGIFAELDGRTFAHTPLSELFRSDIPGSLRYTAISELGGDHYSAWENLLGSVRTGEVAFDARFGMPVWQYYAENPEIGQTFERSMTGITERIDDAIISAYSFAGFDRVLDIGGGEGYLLRSILRENSRAHGIVFDQAEVIGLARRRLSGDPLAERISLIAGDFFDAVPAGVDLHVLKWIVHDWNDTLATRILSNCRASLAPGGTLLLLESVLPSANDGMFPKLMDLNMMVMTGGRERTEGEFRNLLRAAGFKLTRILATGSPVQVIEAEPI